MGRTPSLSDLLNLEALSPVRRRVLNDLGLAEAEDLARTIDLVIEATVSRALDTPPPPDEFMEVWWIRSDADAEWAGLKIATFRKTLNGDVIVIIHNDFADRQGVRH